MHFNLESIMNKIIDSEEIGSLSATDASICRSLVVRYHAVSKGYLTIDLVNAQLARCPVEVIAFFEGLEIVSIPICPVEIFNETIADIKLEPVILEPKTRHLKIKEEMISEISN